MKTSKSPSKNVQLGTLIAAAYDRAAHVTTDTRRARELVAYTVASWLRRTGRTDLLATLDAANLDAGRGFDTFSEAA